MNFNMSFRSDETQEGNETFQNILTGHMLFGKKRVNNPQRNEKAYSEYLKALKAAQKLKNKYDGDIEIQADNPNEPYEIHGIIIRFSTDEKEIKTDKIIKILKRFDGMVVSTSSLVDDDTPQITLTVEIYKGN